MDLKNIFKMTKIDRYTQDGRDELAKLQETEDVRYKTGDISQKTGLQKQPDGSWAPPKHGAKSTAKQEYKEKDRTARTIHNEMQNTKRPTKTITTHIANGFYDEEIRKAAGNKEQLQKIAEKAMSPAYERTGEKVPQEFIKYGTEKLQERYNKMEAAAGGNVGKSKSAEKNESGSFPEWEETRMASGKLYDLKSQGKRIIEQYDPETETKTFKLRDLNNSRSPDKEFKSLEEAKAAAADASPRQLTGDCKIKIRPETQDVKYKTGDISQKTGLQKQPDGSWKPPRNGSKAAAGSEGNTPAGVPSFHGMESGDYDNKLRAEGWETGGWEGNAMHSSAIFKKGDRTIRVVEGQPGKISHVEEIKPTAESKPKTEAKPGSYPGYKPNDVIYYKGSNDDPRPYKIAGTQFWFKTPEEAMTAVVAGTRGEGKTYAKPSSDVTINEIQNALGFKLDSEYAGKYSMDDFMKKTGENEYGVHVWSFGTNSKGTLIDTIVEGYNKPNATIKKENGEWKLHYKDREGKEEIWTATGREFPTGDAAPRQLTGDTKIRIRK